MHVDEQHGVLVENVGALWCVGPEPFFRDLQGPLVLAFSLSVFFLRAQGLGQSGQPR